MKVTIEITDEKKIALVEKLRGEKSAKEFVKLAAEAGLMLAAQNAARGKGRMIKFSTAKDEFRTLDVAAVTEALKDKDPKHPVKLEVSRLVQAYTSELRDHAKENGNRLPSKLKVNTKIAIEQVAFKITADAISSAIKKANQKSVAA